MEVGSQKPDLAGSKMPDLRAVWSVLNYKPLERAASVLL